MDCFLLKHKFMGSLLVCSLCVGLAKVPSRGTRRGFLARGSGDIGRPDSPACITGELSRQVLGASGRPFCLVWPGIGQARSTRGCPASVKA